MESQAPVEYAVAVDEYLSQAVLSAASRRVYRISLAGWAWPLVGKPVPHGAQRRGAVPPVVPLAVLDDPGTARRLGGAVADRGRSTDARTVNREMSALRSAVSWWLEQGWIATDPLASLRHRPPDALGAPLDAGQVAAVLSLPASLREHALWRLLLDSGAGAARVLALDAEHLDLPRNRVRLRLGEDLTWQEPTSQALRWLLAGRVSGPVFVTARRATAPLPADRFAATGQVRLSYRRAAELFTELTRPLDPAGHGWTLHQLSAASSHRAPTSIRRR